MQSGRRYGLIETVSWTRKHLLIFAAISFVPVLLRQYGGLTWVRIPWVPIALIGTAVAFYLGFKNNSSYERLWEARKIWGGIVNASRAWAVGVRDFVSELHAQSPAAEGEVELAHRELVMRHLAWLHSLSFQMRERRAWEHDNPTDNAAREVLGTIVTPESYDKLRDFISDAEFVAVRAKKNTAAQLLGVQSKALADLRRRGLLDDFRHMELQKLLNELYALQGKSERIKNFPFPRQYATVNLFFVWLFIILVPYGMVELFHEMGDGFIWLTVPFSVLVSWVFHTMEMIGDYSENPFEGTYNDVPIYAMATGIEIDMRELIDDTQLPAAPTLLSSMDISV